MPVCIVVPGFLSTELYSDPEHNFRIWVNIPRIVQGEIGELRLAPNGVDPGPPDGRLLFPESPLPDYWDSTLQLLVAGLKPHGYRVASFGFDWRKQLFPAGLGLAEAVRLRATIADPCTIVAHSMGGLVARAAWASLLATGDQGLVRRIITLGTPHQGSYTPIMVASGANESLDQLSFLSNVIGGNGNLIVPTNPFVHWGIIDLRKIALTWPGLYDLMPALDGSDAAADPHRAMLYDRNAWPALVPISAAHLSFGRNVFSPWLLSPATLPPPWILTTVVGTGSPTPSRLLLVEQLGSPQAIGTTDQGDGNVTASSAEVPGSAVYFMQGRHNDLPLIAAQNGDLVKWVLEVRNPFTPPPSPAAIAGDMVPRLAGPPIAQQISTGYRQSPCSLGKCEC